MARGVAAIGEAHITSFILIMNLLTYVALTVGWLRGGHPERFGVFVMLFYALVEISYRDWRVGDIVGQAPVIMVAREQAIGRVVLTLIFCWMAFRSPRWWPLVVAALLVLILLVHLLTILTPIPYNAAVSARVGLWIMLYTTLLVSVFERWMAGEAPVSRIGRDRPGRRQRPANPGNGRQERQAFP